MTLTELWQRDEEIWERYQANSNKPLYYVQLR